MIAQYQRGSADCLSLSGRIRAKSPKHTPAAAECLSVATAMVMGRAALNNLWPCAGHALMREIVSGFPRGSPVWREFISCARVPRMPGLSAGPSKLLRAGGVRGVAPDAGPSRPADPTGLAWARAAIVEGPAPNARPIPGAPERAGSVWPPR
jgi:hypothetical protein